MRELEVEGGPVHAAAAPPHRHHDADGAWDVARRSVASRGTPAGDHRGMLHLQRLAGNASVGALVQREENEGAEEHTDARSPVLDVIGKGGGEPLPTALRTTMERSLGADFSSVRVHSGPHAAASAQAVGAAAYTVGDEIVFNHGAYDPESPRGQHTLAHELTHVVQQRSGPVEGTPTGDGIAVSDPGDRFEREAEDTATAVTAHAQTMPLQRTEGTEEDEPEDVQLTPVQRQEETDEEPEEEIVPE
jgi:hypothetical protein